MDKGYYATHGVRNLKMNKKSQSTIKMDKGYYAVKIISLSSLSS